MQQLEEFKSLSLAKKLIVVTSFLGIGSVLVWFVFTQKIVGWDFRNNLWGPAHLLTRGESPYDIKLLFDGSNSVWMPPIIGAFFPLGWLSKEIASNLWFMFNVILFVTTIGLSIPKRESPYPPGWLVAGLIALLLFPSLLSHLFLGQISIFTTCVLLIASHLTIQKKRFWLVGLLVVLSLAKPQLTPFVLSGIVIYLWDDKPALIRFIRASLLWAIMLTIPLWLAYPNWLEGFMSALQSNPVWAQPSSLTILRAVFNDFGFIVWGVLCGAGLILNLWLWRKYPPQIAVLWSLALTVILTPYVWSWDFVLLIPLLTWSYFSAEKRTAKLAWLAGYIMCWLFFFHIRTTTDNNDVHFWWYGWAMIAVILVTYLVENQHHITSRLSTKTRSAEHLPQR